MFRIPISFLILIGCIVIVLSGCEGIVHRLLNDAMTRVYTMRVELSANGPVNMLSQIDAVLQARVKNLDYKVVKAEVDGQAGKIIYEISGITDTAGIASVFTQTGNLEFYNTYEAQEIFTYLEEANKKLVDIIARLEKEGKTGAGVSTGDKLFGTATYGQEQKPAKVKSPGEDLFGEKSADQETQTTLKSTADNPLFNILYPNIVTEGFATKLGPGPIVGMALIKDTATVNRFLAFEEVKKLFPNDLVLMWGRLPVGTEENVLQLYAIKHHAATPVLLNGQSVTKAAASFDAAGIPQVDVSLNVGGATIFERMTADAASQTPKRCIAIVIDGEVFSAPRVQQQIHAGKMMITGIDKEEEARILASTIQSGKLPVTVNVISLQLIGK